MCRYDEPPYWRGQAYRSIMLNGGLVDSVLIAAANNAQIEYIERYLPREGFIMWIDSHEVEGTKF